jgi:hypothetical protein
MTEISPRYSPLISGKVALEEVEHAQETTTQPNQPVEMLH